LAFSSFFFAVENDLAIKKTPLAIQPFIVRGAICTYDIVNDVLTQFNIRQGTVKPGATTSFRCGLANIDKVWFTTAPFGNALPCLVIGRTQYPAIGDPSNIHLFPPTNLQSFNLTTLGVDKSSPFLSLKAECELSSDYRYFTPYIYTVLSGLPIGGTSSAQGGTYIQQTAMFFINFSGPAF
jgi:hypothetical protein